MVLVNSYFPFIARVMGCDLSMLTLNPVTNGLRTSRALLQDLQAKGGDGQEVSIVRLLLCFHTVLGWWETFMFICFRALVLPDYISLLVVMAFFVACHISSVHSFHVMSWPVKFEPQQGLRWYDQQFLSTPNSPTTFLWLKKHIVKRPSAWLGSDSFDSCLVVPGVSPREVHRLAACGSACSSSCSACSACSTTGREDRGRRGDGGGDARGERLGGITWGGPKTRMVGFMAHLYTDVGLYFRYVVFKPLTKFTQLIGCELGETLVGSLDSWSNSWHWICVPFIWFSWFSWFRWLLVGEVSCHIWCWQWHLMFGN